MADNELLEKIFSKGSIDVGVLKTREDVHVKLSAKTLCSRHFAILAMTGAGKSNTVAVISQQLLERVKGKMNIVIIDPHGEYVKMRNTHTLSTKLNPYFLSEDTLAKLMGICDNAPVQKSFFIYAANTVKYEVRYNRIQISGIEYLEKIEKKLRDWSEIANSEAKTKQINYYDGKYWRTKKLKKDDEMKLNSVIEKLRLFLNKYKDILGDNCEMFNLKSDKINVLPLQKIENEEAITTVGEFLKEVLKERIKATHGEDVKFNAFKKPILVIIEEAHIFAAKNLKDRSGYWISKIAKEGRKFGVGLGLISQRPKELNPTILSQMNTKIILKIIEPTDQRYILESSENIGEDLLSDLPNLSTGEAVIVGSSLLLPALVKIKKYDGVLGGEDGFEILGDL